MRTLRLTLPSSSNRQADRPSNLSMSQSSIPAQYFDFMYTTQSEKDSLFQSFFFLFIGNIEFIESRDSNIIGIWLLLIALLLSSLLIILTMFLLSSIHPLQLSHFYSLVSFVLNYFFIRSVELPPYPVNFDHFKHLFQGALFFLAGFSCLLASVSLIGFEGILISLIPCVLPGVFVEIFVEKSSQKSMIVRMILATIGGLLELLPITLRGQPFSNHFYMGCALSFLGGLLMIKPMHVISCKVSFSNLVQVCHVFLFGLVILLPLGFDFCSLKWPSAHEWMLMLFGGVLLLPLQYYLVRGMQLEPVSSTLQVFLLFSVVYGFGFLLFSGFIEHWYLIPIGAALVLVSFFYGINERAKQIRYSGVQVPLVESEDRNSKEMVVIQ